MMSELGRWRGRDTDDGKYGCEEEEVVGENRSKVEPFIAASWRHG